MEKESIVLKYFITEQHGYIETTLTLLRKLKISRLISPYSKQSGRKVFLEEDKDATLFVKRLNLSKYEVIIEEEDKSHSYFENMQNYSDNVCQDKQFDGFVSECQIHQDVVFTKKDSIKKLKNNIFETPDGKQIKIHPSFFLEGKLLNEKQLQKLGIEIIAVR
jgi:hypothetical protein